MWCKLSNFGLADKVTEGDIFHFIMPNFCDGDYSFPVESINGILYLREAPDAVFLGCRSYTIERAALKGKPSDNGQQPQERHCRKCFLSKNDCKCFSTNAVVRK